MRFQNLLKKINLHKVLDSFAEIFKIPKLTQLQTSLLQYQLCLVVGDICICFTKSSLAALLTLSVKIFNKCK